MPLGMWTSASIHPLPCTRKLAVTVPSQNDVLESRGKFFGSELTGTLQCWEVSSTSITVPNGAVMVDRLLAKVTRTWPAETAGTDGAVGEDFGETDSP